MSEASTIYQVADTAGVSVRTVSRYLNDPTCVSKKTSALIVQAMQALQFHPSKAARALKGVKPNLIGVVMNSLDTKTRGYYYYYYSQDHKKTGETQRPAPAEDQIQTS